MPHIPSRIKSLFVRFRLQSYGISTIPYRKNVDSIRECFVRLGDNFWIQEPEVHPWFAFLIVVWTLLPFEIGTMLRYHFESVDDEVCIFYEFAKDLSHTAEMV